MRFDTGAGPVIRSLFFFLGVSVLLAAPLGCRSTAEHPDPSSAAGTDAASQPMRRASGPLVTLVGVVHQGGTRVCDGAGRETWVRRYYATGFVPLRFDARWASRMVEFKGRTVAVTGFVTAEPPTIHDDGSSPKGTGMLCPVYQMRSDYELWPDGVRRRRSPSPVAGTFQLVDLTVERPIEARTLGTDALIEIKNPFGRPVREATLVAHYEGCYGKPGASREPRALGDLAPDGRAGPVVVPLRVERPAGSERFHRLLSLELQGDVDDGWLDLDVDVASLGVRASCPAR